MAKPFKKALTISTCMLVAIALTIGAVAWFSGYREIGFLGFDTSANANLPEMVMWMYYSENDAQHDSSTTKPSEGWIEQTVGEDTVNNGYFVIPGAGEDTETQVDTAGNTIVDENGEPILLYSYEIPKLHFGKVDNLVTLKPDNKVMLRFFFDASTLNNTEGKLHNITFTLAYNTSGYSYDKTAGVPSVLDSIHLLKEVDGGAEEVVLKDPANQEKIDEAVSSNAGKAENETVAVPDPIYVLECLQSRPGAMQFLQIRYAVSAKTAVYAPIGDGFGREVTVKNEDNTETTTTEMLTLSNPLPINCGFGSKNENCKGCQENKCGKITLSADDLKAILGKPNEDDGTYNIGEGFYVYIELAPMLDAFGMQENILDYFVPAYMFFDVKLDVEIG